MTDNEHLESEQDAFKIMLNSVIKNESMILSPKKFWQIVRLCYENYDRLEKRKDT